MPFIDEFPPVDSLRNTLRKAYVADETECAQALLAAAQIGDKARARIFESASKLVEGARAHKHRIGSLDAFLQEYALSSPEGVVLMCLAEALLRIPDAETADKFIRDKVGPADWERHLGQSDSVLVNASTWGLMLTGRVVGWNGDNDLLGVLRRMVARSGEPVIRNAMVQSMRILGRQFVMGRTIKEALSRSAESENRNYRYSFDMLGEAALTAADAETFFEAYVAAIAAIGAARGEGPVEAAPGVSVKLSALHPRYEFAQRRRVMTELVPRLKALALKARDADIGFAVDAEEAARLDLSLDVIEAVYADPELNGWNGFGLAVQAYLKRAPALIDWLTEMAGRHDRPLMVRLVKGAYWDSEIKHSQAQAHTGYPVYTRKVTTDVCFLACVKRLFAAPDRFYPQFATHNAHTIAAVIEMAGDLPFEFQRLHGMGEPLYNQIVGGDVDVPCRVYAPVGPHRDLLPYLVRRLLENGANTSFINRLSDATAPIEEIVADPVARLAELPLKPHPGIPLPHLTVGADRIGGVGVDLTDPLALAPLAVEMDSAERRDWQSGPIVAGKIVSGQARDVVDPADRRRVVGQVTEADVDAVAAAASSAAAAAPGWDAAGAEARAACLDRTAELFEENRAALMTLCVREAGKTVDDAVAEIREAVDFCRYYAARARAEFGAPEGLPGPTGERNELAMHGRGVFACISPWNFPLAIFAGQVSAALAAGNAVIAKPAEQTPLIAAEAVRLMYAAGVPGDVLHLLPGSGATVGAALVGDRRIDGVAFTGSTETAQAINRGLAARDGPIAPLIAETGGQNAMIVDSSALPEQVVRDVVGSAFRSAGQRCSALRVLFVQADVAPRMLEMLVGAMEELVVGDPALLATDIGPVIDAAAHGMLEAHAERMRREGTELYRVALPKEAKHGTFFAPAAFEIDGLQRLEREVFGPILHVVRYAAGRLDDVLESVRNTRYGLTLGIHSRIDETIRHIHAAMPVGNVYVNRDMVGAIVGVQPFGGEGLSGTGPKAGGPHYLHRFAVERTLSVNTAAMGGNATLMSLAEDAAG